MIICEFTPEETAIQKMWQAAQRQAVMEGSIIFYEDWRDRERENYWKPRALYLLYRAIDASGIVL